MKTAIMIDEINAMHQFHRIGVQGIKPWRVFFEAIERSLQKTYLPRQQVKDIDFMLFGALIPKEIDELRHHKRKGFFDALVRDGIDVKQGFCVGRFGEVKEKGVDVTLALDLYEKAISGYDLIIVFSADADIVPAIRKAKEKGAMVCAVLGYSQPASLIREFADAILPLEDIISMIPGKSVLQKTF